ncbi:MAG: CBS and ACT domain-containing protein [Caldilineaceae bacterium]
MLVRDRMTSPAITITADTPFQEAVKLMREKGFRRLPVVNKDGRMVGIVSERDLLHAAPSPASSLSIWEMNYLLWKLKIDELMTKNVLTVTPDMPVEEAARLMVAHKIGGLPVVDEAKHVVGVITETDIFKAFVDMLGGGDSGVRLVIEVPSAGGVLAKLSQTIFELGGNIISVGSMDKEGAEKRHLVIKVRGVEQQALIDAMESLGDHVVDARTV